VSPTRRASDDVPCGRGPTIVYAVVQAIGLVNDHEVRCLRFREAQHL
jgi:3-methyladenine DNA glycosylase Tag